MTRNESMAGNRIGKPEGDDGLFFSVFKTIPTGILLVDIGNRTICGINPAARKMFGRPENAILGHPLAEFFSPDPAHETLIPDFLAGGKAAGFMLTDADHNEIPVLLHPSPAISGKSPVIVVSVLDISERTNERSILLREIHHRVKNNMQLITGILDMEGLKIRDPSIRILFENSKSRIRALAAVHEIAYRSHDFAHIPVKELINAITSCHLSTLSPEHGTLSLTLDCGPATLDLDTAVPFGILINELVSNSVIHAFPGGRDGIIVIRYSVMEDARILEYCDNGVGFPPIIDFAAPQTTGLELIRGLTGEINGRVELLAGPGTRYRFTFPHPCAGGTSS